jgi:2-polyprenyl-6-hydroxyphenyl methylase/3-demethylubiquinone-9 3-methyltransferase
MNTVNPEEIAKFSAMAAQWWDETGPFKPLHRMNPIRIEAIRDQACRHFGLDSASLQPLAGKKLVDIGCGGGLIAEPMARMGAEVTGIDASERNIGVASLHAEQSGLAIDYRATTAEALAETHAGQFDMVLSLEVLEHVADVPAFISACAQLCKPGGMLVFATLNRTAKSFALAIVGAEYLLRWLPRGTHHWSAFLKPSELVSHLEDVGVQVSYLTGMVYHPLTGQWRLDARDMSVNYMVVGVR